MFDAIVFAGGGNRCYWQGGFYEAMADRLGTPSLAVGVSAGAFAGIYSLLGIGPQVRERVLAACGPHLRNIDFAGWRAGGRLYPVGAMYPALLDAVIDGRTLARLQERTDLHVAISRLPRGVSAVVGAAIGIGAYQLEKRLLHPVHPRFGRRLGFRAEFVRVRDLNSPSELCTLLVASSSVPPFMPIVEIGGRPALDGGLVDNVPVEPLEPIEAAGGRTLVLLTRRYDHLPQAPGRTYVQPSQRIRAKQFDVTDPEGIRAAYELGLADGRAFAQSIVSSCRQVSNEKDNP
jgi:predicted acylesterase/phospholipase RssA